MGLEPTLRRRHTVGGTHLNRDVRSRNEPWCHAHREFPVRLQHRNIPSLEVTTEYRLEKIEVDVDLASGSLHSHGHLQVHITIRDHCPLENVPHAEGYSRKDKPPKKKLRCSVARQKYRIETFTSQSDKEPQSLQCPTSLWEHQRAVPTHELSAPVLVAAYNTNLTPGV